MPESRIEAVNRIAQYLRRKSQPRLLLFIILLFTGIIGAASSFIMFHAGITRMFIRYPLAAFFAYAVFLLLLRLWRDHQVRQPDIAVHFETTASETSSDTAPNMRKEEDKRSYSKRSFLDSLDALNIVNIFDEAPGFFICVLIALVVGALFLIGLVLSAAPTLLAEILLDGLLVAGIWRRFKRTEEDDNPLGAAFRITRIPALLVICVLTIVGYLFEFMSPTAQSIGDVFRSFLTK
jgi:hypothetical protein